MSEVTEKENPELDVPEESPRERPSFREIWDRVSKSSLVALLLPFFAYVAYAFLLISFVQLLVISFIGIILAILSTKE